MIGQAISDRSESPAVEFKDARGGLPNGLWKTITSFSLRRGGGIIVFGIKEDRLAQAIEVVGLTEIAELQESLSNYFNDKLANIGRPNYDLLDYEGHRILVLKVDEVSDDLKPPYYKELGLPRGACIRDGITDRTITDEEMKRFIRNSSLVFKFDKNPAPGTNLATLSEDKITAFLEKSAQRAGRAAADNTPSDRNLLNVSIATDTTGQVIPTVAGFLIFSSSPPQDVQAFSRLIIRCVRYSGSDAASQIIDKQDVIGTLDEQIDAVYTFILRNIARKAQIVGSQRKESYEYPEEAVREIVANAVIHRDYTITETYTQINIFADRIEVSNPGNLPPGVTISNIKEAQFSRNEVIASILRDLDFLEEYGRGIDIVFSKMEEYGLLPPLFKNTANSFKVILLGESISGLNERQVEIWQRLLEVRRMTAREMVSHLGESVSRPTINNDIRKLQELGLITQVGSSRNIAYEPRY